MLKVLLAYRCPDEGLTDSRLAALPSGLPWLAAAVRSAGAEPLVANFSRLPWKDVESFLAELRPDVVAVSAWPCNLREVGRLLRLARQVAPGSLRLAGGPLVDERRRELLDRWKEADLLIPGEGEALLEATCRAFAQGGTAAASAVPGVLLRGRTAGPGLAPPADLDALAAPSADVDLAGIEPERDLRFVVASRARTRGEAEAPPALRSSAGLAAEMKARRARFGLVDFTLLGPGLVRDRSLLPALAGRLREAKVGARWEISATVADLTAEAAPSRDRGALRAALLDAAAAGCRRVRLDLEAGAGPLPAARERLAAVSETLRSVGLLPVATLRVGWPEHHVGAELEELRAMVRALRPVEADLESRIPPPPTEGGTELADPAGEDEEVDEAELARERLSRVEEALEPTLREVRRSARSGPRELEARRARGGGGPWIELDWGDYRAGSGDLEEAARHYARAAEAEPWNVHPWLRLARLRGRGDARHEAEALREVLHRVPEHAGARLRLEELRDERGRSRRPRRRRGAGKGSET